MPTRLGTTYRMEDSAPADHPPIEAVIPALPGSPAVNVDTPASTSVMADLAGTTSQDSFSSPLSNVESMSEDCPNALGVSVAGSDTAVETRSWASVVASNISPSSAAAPLSSNIPPSSQLAPSSLIVSPSSRDALLSSNVPPSSNTAPSSNKEGNTESQAQAGFITPRSPARAAATRPSTPITTSPRYFKPWFDGDTGPAVVAQGTPRQRSNRVFDKSFEEYDEEGGLGEIPADWHTAPSVLSLSYDKNDIENDIFDALSPTTRQIMLGLSPTTRNKVLGRAEVVAAQANQPDNATSPATTTTADGGRVTPRIPTAAKGKRVDPRNRRAGIAPVNAVNATPTGSQQVLYRDEILAEDARMADILQSQLWAETAAEEQEALRRRKHAKRLRQARGDPPPVNEARHPTVPARQARQAPPLAVLTPEVVQGIMTAPQLVPLARTSVPRTVITDTSAPATTARPARASAQMPSSGFLWQVLGAAEQPPEDGSSSDGKSSDSVGSEPTEIYSSDSETTRRRKKNDRKAWRKLRDRRKREEAALKAEPPFVYNGAPNYDVYQKWVYEVLQYMKQGHVRSKHRVSRLKKYLSDRASTFFMTEVAVNAGNVKWTLPLFLRELFNYCFPPNFRNVRRQRFNECSQRGRTVRDYLRDLQDIANSVGDVSTRQLVIRFWDGAAHYLKVKWAEAGFDPEISSLVELEISAERYELAEQYRRRQESHNTDQRQSKSSKTTNVPDATRSDQRDRSRRPNGRSSGSNSRSQPTHKSTMSAKPDSNRRVLSREEMNELRAQNRCFECKQPGHLGKD